MIINSLSKEVTFNWENEYWVINSAQDSVKVKSTPETETIKITDYPNAANFISGQVADAIRQLLQQIVNAKEH